MFSARLLPALAHRGHAITVIAGHHRAGLPDATDYDGVRVHRFPFHQILSANDLQAMSAVLRAVARLKADAAPDLVHVNTLGPSVLFHLRTERPRPTPVLLTLHSPMPDDAARRDTLAGQMLRDATWVNTNSHAVRTELCRQLPAMADRSSVIYYGMPVPALAPAPRPRTPPVVLAFGRLVVDKGFDLALRAFAVVRRTFPEARLVIAGDGPARAELEQLAAELDVAAATDFIGAVPPEAIPALINAASVVAVPSRWPEPFGLVALEAALMARPVVAARVGGLVEAVEDGTTGLLIEREDWRALGDAIVRVLADPAAADAMGAAAARRARERFAWERCIDEYERLYEHVTDRGLLPDRSGPATEKPDDTSVD